MISTNEIICKRRRDEMTKSDIPPLPLRNRTPSKLNCRDDSTTIGTTAPLSHSSSFSEYSFQTPSTRTKSPEGYDMWSLASTQNKVKIQDPSRKIILEGIPKCTSSPFRRSAGISPCFRRSQLPVSRQHSSPSHISLVSSHTRRSSHHTPIRLERKESILDLTDSEDEDSVVDDADSMIDDSSLLKLIRVTSNTLSEGGKILEDESVVELHPYRNDLEDDGLENELEQLQCNENIFHSQISSEVDKVAYGHESVSEWNEKFVPNRRNNDSHLPSEEEPEEEGSTNVVDSIIGLCICCGNAKSVSR